MQYNAISNPTSLTPSPIPHPIPNPNPKLPIVPLCPAYYECGPHPWDVCAGACLVEEAGDDSGST
jgi:hypothetical protein